MNGTDTTVGVEVVDEDGAAEMSPLSAGWMKVADVFCDFLGRRLTKAADDLEKPGTAKTGSLSLTGTPLTSLS